MLKFDETLGVSKLLGQLLGGLVVGAVVGWLVLQGLDRFSPLLTREAAAPAVGVGGVVFLVFTLAGLRGARVIQVDADVLRLTPWVGLPKEYPLATHTFSPVLGYHRGSATQRSLAIEGHDGSRALIPLSLAPHRFDELVRLVHPQEPTAPAPWLAAQPQDAPTGVAAQEAPAGLLNFAPRTFVIRRGVAPVFAWIVIAFGVLIFAGFAVLAAQVPAKDSIPGILGFGLLMMALVSGLGLVQLRLVGGLPRSVVVAPEHVTFGTQTFRYEDLYVLELPAPGLLPVQAKVRLRTMAGVDHTIKVVARNPKQFLDYPAFATLLREAANAVKPVVNYRYSG